jgi:diguanylate cyclase (GGDEF)-like protein/PAS domain S-box-containing protein
MKRILFHHEQFFSPVFDHIHDGIVVLNPDLAITYMNPAAEKMSALNSRNVLGCGIHQVFSLIEPQNLSALLPALFSGAEETGRNADASAAERIVSFNNAILKSYEGVTLIVEGNICRLPAGLRDPQGYILVFRDITGKKRSAPVEYRSHYDLLTGLPNREGLTMQLKKMLGDWRQDSRHTLLELEVDGLGNIVREADIPGAEEILKQVAAVLRSQIQQKDIAARISAGTFILALRDCSIRDAVLVAGRINVAVSGHVFKYRGLEFSLSASMGLVALSGRKTNIDTLLRSARAACTYAKQEAGNRIFCYT